MKFTIVFITLLSISSTWCIKARIEEPKDKRDASSYISSHGGSSHGYSAPAVYSAPATNQLEASAVSIGAGYSVGGAKPSYSFGEQGSGATYQFQPQGLPGSGHATIQLAPITLQPTHGGLVSNDLSQLMSQLSHGINSGAIAIPSGDQGALYQFAGHGSNAAQDVALPQLSYGSPKFQQYSLGEQSQGVVPTYALGTKGLGTFGSTGPVLFSPESSANQASASYNAPASGHSYEGAALSLGDSGHSFPGFSLGGSGQQLGSLKGISSYAAPGKTSFKPSTFLGASVQSDSGLTGSHGAPSFSNYQAATGGHGATSVGSSGHGLSFGSLSAYSGSPSKLVAPTYLPSKNEGFGSLESIASAFSASGQIASPGTTYGTPSSSYSTSNAHAASAPSPAYYVTSHRHTSPSFGSGSTSYRGPVSGHNSFSSSPKYSFGGHSGSRYLPPKDIQGAYSEPSYNTIKYSEELKPRHN